MRLSSCIAEVTFAVGERMLRLRDIADVRRGFIDPPQPRFRIDGEPAIGLAIAIPLTLAVVFPMMDIVDIDLQRVSLGALIIALAIHAEADVILCGEGY